MSDLQPSVPNSEHRESPASGLPGDGLGPRSHSAAAACLHLEDRIPFLVLVLDLQGRVDRLNGLAQHLLGTTLREARGRAWDDLLQSQLRIADVLADLKAGKMVAGLSDWPVGAAGRRLMVRWHFALMNPTADQAEHVLALGDDLSASLAASQILQESHRRQFAQHLSGAIVHPFNNYLTVIMGNAQLLRSLHPEDPLLTDGLDQIIASSRQAAALTTALLNYAERGKWRDEPTNLHDLIAAVAAETARSCKGIEIWQDLRAEPAVTTTDPVQLRFALRQLAKAACDEMPNGGKLVFATANCTIDPDQARPGLPPLAPGRYVQISVSDSAKGKADIDRRLFEPAPSVDDLGDHAALGMSSVYAAARLQGGCALAYAQAGGGTSVRIYLPARPQPASALPQASPVTPPTASPSA